MEQKDQANSGRTVDEVRNLCEISLLREERDETRAAINERSERGPTARGQ